MYWEQKGSRVDDGFRVGNLRQPQKRFLHDVVNILFPGPASANKGVDFVSMFQEQVMQETGFGFGHRLRKTEVASVHLSNIHARLCFFQYQ